MDEEDDQNYGNGEEMEDLDINQGLVGMDEDGEDYGEELDMGEDEPQVIDEEQFMQMSESQQQAYIF